MKNTYLMFDLMIKQKETPKVVIYYYYLMDVS